MASAFVRRLFALWHIVTCLTAFQTVKAAVLYQAHVVRSHAKIAVLVALAIFFHLLTNVAQESSGHERTVTRIFFQCN